MKHLLLNLKYSSYYKYWNLLLLTQIQYLFCNMKYFCNKNFLHSRISKDVGRGTTNVPDQPNIQNLTMIIFIYTYYYTLIDSKPISYRALKYIKQKKACKFLPPNLYRVVTTLRVNLNQRLRDVVDRSRYSMRSNIAHL